MTTSIVAAWLLLAAEPPQPPPDMRSWVDYARRAMDSGPACPPGQACVQIQRVELRGRADNGTVTMSFAGANLGRSAESVALLGPAATFSVTATRWRAGRGVVRLAGDAWAARVEPGAFTVEADVQFEAAPSVPLQLGAAVSRIADRLDRGSVAFDESSDRHGGVMFLQSETLAKESDREVSIRVTRAFKYGSVVTFTYRYTVTGLREQARVDLPILGGETVEAVEPAIPYSASSSAIALTLTPGSPAVEASGHFAAAPDSLAKPPVLPFEYWLFDSDQRHPVQLSTDGVEIDPGEVPDLTPGARSRAYFMVERQTLVITPMEVTVDKGRLGAGTARITYTQGRNDKWVGTLSLTSTTAPESDRIMIPTPAPPHYAESGGEPVRLFKDGETLSLRVVTADDRLAPIQVQWREAVSANAFFSGPKLAIPGQGLHLDDETVEVGLLPGFVPIAVLGVQTAHGHLVDGLHIYALLIALLGVALARGGRFPVWALVVTAILLAGLYTVEAFPRVSLLLVLTGCAILVRLPDRILDKLRSHRVLHVLVSIAWLAVLVPTIVLSVLYVKDRVFSALHPWSQVETGPSLSFALRDEAAPSGGDEYGEYGVETDEAEERAKGETEQWQERDDLPREVAPAPQQRPEFQRLAIVTIPKATEKTIRPVAFETPSLPASRVEYSFGALLPGDGAAARIILAGPLLRGLWMFAECFGFAALLALAIVRARRLWTRGEVK